MLSSDLGDSDISVSNESSEKVAVVNDSKRLCDNR